MARTHNLSARYENSNANAEHPIASGRYVDSPNVADTVGAPPRSTPYDLHNIKLAALHCAHTHSQFDD